MWTRGFARICIRIHLIIPVIIFLLLFILVIKIDSKPTLGHTFSLFFPRVMNTFKQSKLKHYIAINIYLHQYCSLKHSVPIWAICYMYIQRTQRLFKLFLEYFRNRSYKMYYHCVFRVQEIIYVKRYLIVQLYLIQGLGLVRLAYCLIMTEEYSK